ncbi:hypothetical protein GY45DRAFT_1029408 [Cubamyces sp. BRFM 1775]|nr:hypothetical protein GY45DRAFT_1029408 [Cubamyces sp. BRFM 1775]
MSDRMPAMPMERLSLMTLVMPYARPSREALLLSSFVSLGSRHAVHVTSCASVRLQAVALGACPGQEGLNRMSRITKPTKQDRHQVSSSLARPRLSSTPHRLPRTGY